jgi:hypothetical protein
MLLSVSSFSVSAEYYRIFNTSGTGDADLRFCVINVKDG